MIRSRGSCRILIEVMLSQIDQNVEDFPSSDSMNAFIRQPKMCSSKGCNMSLSLETTDLRTAKFFT